MKKILILILLILCCTSSVFSGDNDDQNSVTQQQNSIFLKQFGILAFIPNLEKAEQGNASAQGAVGYAYFFGDLGVTQDYTKAVYWLTKAAEQGDTDTQNFLGMIYSKGEGVTQDYKQAVYWYTKAAEQGNASAQMSVGYAYFSGEGVTQDYKQAAYWYTKAAEQGNASAQYFIGAMHVKGEGVTQDYKQAAYWYTKAAEQGNASAQYFIGAMHANGKGVTQNYKIAYVWWSLSAAQGSKKAIENRNMVAENLTPQQLAEAQELAAKMQYQIDHPTKTQEKQSSIGNTERKVTGSGTGFIITKDGYILTCHHVIEDAYEIKISVGGNIYPATLVREDPNNDLALLKINGSFPAIAFSPNRSAKMGQEVFTIGYPNPSLQGVNAKITKGIVNSLTGFQDDLRLYQISVPVQPGNSGGALLDENGNVLGVVMAMLDAKTTFKISGSLPQNVNYAVKSTYALAMLDTLPEIFDKLIEPLRSKSDAVEKVEKSTVMILSYQ
ncbi:MAG: tetratricopeptide repeat-containing serine protease family protein [Pseudomonadota bacterium]